MNITLIIFNNIFIKISDMCNPKNIYYVFCIYYKIRILVMYVYGIFWVFRICD